MSQTTAFVNARAAAGAAPRPIFTNVKASAFVGTPVGQRVQGLMAKPMALNRVSSRGLAMKVSAVRDGAVLDRPLRVAVIGGGPSGACAAETLAKGGVETFLLERKMDNCKVRAIVYK